MSRLGGYYLEGRADDIDFENQLVEVAGVNDSDGRKFYGKPRFVIDHAFFSTGTRRKKELELKGIKQSLTDKCLSLDSSLRQIGDSSRLRVNDAWSRGTGALQLPQVDHRRP